MQYPRALAKKVLQEHSKSFLYTELATGTSLANTSNLNRKNQIFFFLYPIPTSIINTRCTLSTGQAHLHSMSLVPGFPQPVAYMPSHQITTHCQSRAGGPSDANSCSLCAGTPFLCAGARTCSTWMSLPSPLPLAFLFFVFLMVVLIAALWSRGRCRLARQLGLAEACSSGLACRPAGSACGTCRCFPCSRQAQM